MTVMNLEKLEVWVNAKDFAVAIYHRCCTVFACR